MYPKKHKRGRLRFSNYTGPRYDTRDYFRYHRKKRGWRKAVREVMYRQMVIDMFTWLFENRLMKFNRVRFPYRMGEAVIKERQAKFIKNRKTGEIVKLCLVDWKKTRQLWAEDYAAKKRSVKVYLDLPYYYKFRYETEKNDYLNAMYYDMYLSPSLTERIFYEMTIKRDYY